MQEKNTEIKEYLNYYFRLKTQPQYAVMLKGRWGTGKTWFIEKCIEEFKNDDGKALYISLYGITDTKQIEDEFFRQLHPVLGSKSAAFAGRLLKGVLKGTLKIDIDGDKKDDGSISIAIPDLNLPEYLRDTNGLVLIFDDLERCSLPIADILGYINYFVEHDGRKVILIGNEDEILKSEEDSEESNFRRIKEKLIGKTFEITPNFSDAIESFIKEVDLESSRELLFKHEEIIKKTYANADYKNLRHLRQAILDFARLIEILESESRKHDQLVSHILAFFLLYSFEIKSGFLKASEINQIGKSLYSSIGQNKPTTPETLYTKLSKKYTGLSLLDTLLPVPLWEDIFESGLFDSVEINKSLRNSKYFLSKNQPNWVKLWNAFSLSDSELDGVIKSVEEDFITLKITELGALRHVVASLMNLSELGIYGKSKKDISDIGIQTLQKMKENGSLRTAFLHDDDFLRATGYAGMVYHQTKGSDFIEFTNDLKKLGEESLKLGYPQEAQDLLEKIDGNLQEFCELLIHSNYRNNRLQSIPILSYIPLDAFLEKIKKLNPEQLSLLNETIKDRYSTEFYRLKLKEEIIWLTELAQKVNVEKQARAGRMSGVFLGYLETSALDAVESLNQTP